jgi:hypothetical protein
VLQTFRQSSIPGEPEMLLHTPPVKVGIDQQHPFSALLGECRRKVQGYRCLSILWKRTRN